VRNSKLFIHFYWQHLSGKPTITPYLTELCRMMDVKLNGKGYHDLHYISYEMCTIYIKTNCNLVLCLLLAKSDFALCVLNILE
jgi:hypothetical protein